MPGWGVAVEFGTSGSLKRSIHGFESPAKLKHIIYALQSAYFDSGQGCGHRHFARASGKGALCAGILASLLWKGVMNRDHRDPSVFRDAYTFRFLGVFHVSLVRVKVLKKGFSLKDVDGASTVNSVQDVTTARIKRHKLLIQIP